MGVRAIGARVQRTEDPPLLTGSGQFVDDIHLPQMLHAAFVRASIAHARLRAVDAAAARGMPGVRAILTAADMPEPMRSVRMPMLMPNPAITNLATQYCLASEEVCYVGEAIAIVVADSRQLAEDAVAAIVIDYEPLDTVGDCRNAVAAGAPRAHADAGSNVAASFAAAYGDVEAAFASAAHVVRETLWQHRGCGHALECRGVLARFDPADGMLTVWSATQTPHLARGTLADLLGRDPETIRVIAPDVGGGFGPKAVFYAEDAVVAAAALRLGRPVKWIEDRREHFLAATQERDQYWTLELALDGDGRLRGLRGTMLHDTGAYVPWGIIMPFIAAVTVPGPYVLPAYRLDVTVAYTNKVPTTPVRGAGRPQAVFAMERLLDRAARELGLDPAEIRRRNFIAPAQMPYAVGLTFRDGKPVVYDSGDYPACQDKALARARYDEFPVRQAEARRHGRHVGIGIGNYVEGTGLGPFEGVTVRVLQNGRIAVRSGAAPQGQGHKTTLAQICAERLNQPLERIQVTVGDTGAIAMGIGTFASRITANAGPSALMAADSVHGQILALAARVLETDAAELTLEDGRVEVTSGNRRGIGLGELARLAQGMPGFSFPAGQGAGLEHTAYFAPSQAAYCNGCHVVEVEVDIGTGAVRILNYVVAHDSGTLVNPLIVDGQIQGAVAHGIGNALYEWMVYDAAAQPLTTTFADYLLPSATEVPNIDSTHLETPSPLNPLGAKGAGEGGTIPAAAAIAAAIENALAPFGVRIAAAPITPAALIALLRASPAWRDVA
ncbi:MAG TPA: xanthine dehydrogenase family protein molybdopterin-binding subunit [Stellaceae bacterium]|nr:xanthine dehydrogenase family protein molybdopterin-binding subunit [Stellaceae bacterium]